MRGGADAAILWHGLLVGYLGEWSGDGFGIAGGWRAAEGAHAEAFVRALRDEGPQWVSVELGGATRRGMVEAAPDERIAITIRYGMDGGGAA